MTEPTSTAAIDEPTELSHPHSHTVLEAIVESPFVQDQESLLTERGIVLNIIMVGIALAACTTLAIYWFRS